MAESDMSKQFIIAVGIATAGRRDVLSRTITHLASQTRLPDTLVICPVKIGDVDTAILDAFPTRALAVTGAVGLPAQRNLILKATTDADIIVFFDDDFIPEANYLANLERTFRDSPELVGLTGTLLADGIHGPGLNFDQGLAIIHATAPATKEGRSVEVYGTYGCNMAFRLAPIRSGGLLFDENLPLYGWQEDIDFSLQIAPYGKIAKSDALLGVHLGIKAGRSSGAKFGYSQIANPIYLIRKGTMSWQHARKLMWRNLASNVVRSLHPEPWVDRRGRLKGNLLALKDMASGRISPRRILHLD
jgi:GT2 family glycosyltransferase